MELPVSDIDVATKSCTGVKHCIVYLKYIDIAWSCLKSSVQSELIWMKVIIICQVRVWGCVSDGGSNATHFQETWINVDGSPMDISIKHQRYILWFQIPKKAGLWFIKTDETDKDLLNRKGLLCQQWQRLETVI